MPNATVEITVTVDGISKTFTASADTTGEPARAARGILMAAQNDATSWTHELEDAHRKAARR